MQEYEKYNDDQLDQVEQQVCCDENTPCVPINVDIDNSNNKKITSSTTNTTESLESAERKPQKLQIPVQELRKDDCSHKGEKRHSKKIEELDREQQILLKDNKEVITDFLLDNIDSIRLEDLKIYETIYKCYREKGNCHICNSLTNIICRNCSNDPKGIWLCINHWKQHTINHH